jgi:hypothetical protein
MSTGLKHLESYRALIRAISIHEKEILAACDRNEHYLIFLQMQYSEEKAMTSSLENDMIAIEKNSLIIEETDVAVKSSKKKKIDTKRNEQDMKRKKRSITEN